jgi:RimJ/RimL family protein N-acetyltransferase
MALTYPEPDLRDGFVLLRPWAESDLGAVAEACTDTAMIETTTLPVPGVAGDAIGWIHRQWERLSSGEGISLAVVPHGTGVAAGAVALLAEPDAGTASLGIWLLQEARGRGYATSAIRLVAHWGLAAGNLGRIEARLEPANDRSRRMVERAGLVFEGRLRSALALPGRRADALLYSLVSQDITCANPSD